MISLYPDAFHVLNPERVQVLIGLPLEMYNGAETPIQVLIPTGYRATGPDGFLVPAGLQLLAGGLPASDASGIGLAGWLLMSFHFMDAAGTSTWRGTADPAHGDNMISYIESVRAFLAAGCN